MIFCSTMTFAVLTYKLCSVFTVDLPEFVDVLGIKDKYIKNTIHTDLYNEYTTNSLTNGSGNFSLVLLLLM